MRTFLILISLTMGLQAFAFPQLGELTLSEDITGNCPKTVRLESDNPFILKLSFSPQTIVNNYFAKKINDKKQVSTRSCPTAGPAIPFCNITDEDLSLYSLETKSLTSLTSEIKSRKAFNPNTGEIIEDYTRRFRRMEVEFADDGVRVFFLKATLRKANINDFTFDDLFYNSFPINQAEEFFTCLYN